jgi:hypothetical protein
MSSKLLTAETMDAIMELAKTTMTYHQEAQRMASAADGGLSFCIAHWHKMECIKSSVFGSSKFEEMSADDTDELKKALVILANFFKAFVADIEGLCYHKGLAYLKTLRSGGKDKIEAAMASTFKITTPKLQPLCSALQCLSEVDSKLDASGLQATPDSILENVSTFVRVESFAVSEVLADLDSEFATKCIGFVDAFVDKATELMQSFKVRGNMFSTAVDKYRPPTANVM